MRAINQFCPRSGKKIEYDSLTEYRGYVVGFSNPGCRDDFAMHITHRYSDTRYFDNLIEEWENGDEGVSDCESKMKGRWLN